MIAVVNIELYRYEIHSLLKAFYPQETVKVFVGEPDAGRYPDPAFLRVQFEENRIEMQITGEGGPVPDEKGAGENGPLTRSVKAPEGAVFNAKGPECKTAAKHLLYNMLSEYTGTVLPWGELIGIRPTKIAMTRLRAGDTPDEAAAYILRGNPVLPHNLPVLLLHLFSAHILEGEGGRVPGRPGAGDGSFRTSYAGQNIGYPLYRRRNPYDAGTGTVPETDRDDRTLF